MALLHGIIMKSLAFRKVNLHLLQLLRCHLENMFHLCLLMKYSRSREVDPHFHLQVIKMSSGTYVPPVPSLLSPTVKFDSCAMLNTNGNCIFDGKLCILLSSEKMFPSIANLFIQK